ncbi:g6550 [Coccomyxa elongata]
MDEPFLLGLTGSIGMGKSTVSHMFMEEGIPVFDADQVVHRLYSEGGDAVPLIGKHFPEAVVDGAVDRQQLGKYVVGNQVALKELEDIVHPLVSRERQKWLLQMQEEGGHSVLLLDIPLLFETAAEDMVDGVAVVSAPSEMQQARVLARPGMTEERLKSILARQMPNEEKCQRANFVINTGVSLEETKEHVRALLKGLRGRKGTAYNVHFAN